MQTTRLDRLVGLQEGGNIGMACLAYRLARGCIIVQGGRKSPITPTKSQLRKKAAGVVRPRVLDFRCPMASPKTTFPFVLQMENLGPVKKATLDLRDMTILVGGN